MIGASRIEEETGRIESGRKKRVWPRILILSVLAVVMALLAAACVLYRIWVVKPTLPAAGTASVLDTSDGSAVQPKVSGQRRSEEIYTILIVGVDTMSNSTDTMMLVTYDVTGQRATVMSIPQDTLVNVKSGETHTRLNSIYDLYGGGEAGMNALTREVAELVGFVPDYRVLINLELVGQMVDAIGGVWFNVPCDMEYDDPGQDLSIRIGAGMQTLDGEHAMQLVRWRKNSPVVSGEDSSSDINRLDIQHDFLTATLKQVLQIKNVFKLGQLVKLFGENVDGDLTVENLAWFACQAVFGGLEAGQVEFTTMPLCYLGEYVYPDQEGLLAAINEKLNPYVTDVTIGELDLITGNADGSLSSSTGVLADPKAAAPTVTDEEDPDTENPDTEDPDTEDPDTEDPDTENPDTENPDTVDPGAEGSEPVQEGLEP